MTSIFPGNTASGGHNVEQVIYRYLDAACPVLDTGATCIMALPV